MRVTQVSIVVVIRDGDNPPVSESRGLSWDGDLDSLEFALAVACLAQLAREAAEKK